MKAWEIVSEIARTVLIMSATGGVIALVLFALKPLVKNRIPKSIQYYLWILVLIALLVPFSAFLSIPVSTPLAPVQEIIEANIKSTAELQEELAQERYNMPYEELDAPEQIEISFREIGLMNGEFNNYILFALITMGGVVFLIEIGQYLVYVIKLRRSRFPARGNEAALLQQLCESRRPPRIYRNPLALTPMLIGIFRPIIYLPDMEYSEAQIKNILFHELTHLRRHDVIVKWIATLTVHIHWFNPIAYFVRREIDRACELACDEAVIKSLDTDGKQSYGDTLIDMAADTKKPKVIVSTTMCEEKKTLKERLGAIMKHKRFSVLAMAVSCVLIVSVLCGTVVLGASAKQEDAAEYFLYQYRDEAAGVRPASILAQRELDDGNILLFYYNAKGNLGCAIIEKRVFGYRVVNTSAEMMIDGNVPAQVLSGQYNAGNKWFAWGILRDSSIETATFYGQEVSIVEADNLRLCYMDGDGWIPTDDNFLFFDSYGNVVWDITVSSFTKAMTVYVWKEQDSIKYALFDSAKADRTEDEVKNSEMIFSDISDLNAELTNYAIEGMHLYIQHSVTDFTKEEMQEISDQIEIPVGNYSTSTGTIEAE